jgi:hypothetical protein
VIQPEAPGIRLTPYERVGRLVYLAGRRLHLGFVRVSIEQATDAGVPEKGRSANAPARKQALTSQTLLAELFVARAI